MVSYGVCRRKECMFAHNENEFEFGCCRRRNCVSRDCIYKHSWEKLDEFKARTNFIVPEKIKRNSYLNK